MSEISSHEIKTLSAGFEKGCQVAVGLKEDSLVPEDMDVTLYLDGFIQGREAVQRVCQLRELMRKNG